MKILSVVGARPNFMKVAPVHRALIAEGMDARLVHTGQHYDHTMSQSFLDDLEMPTPDHNLCVKSGSHALQTARILETFEKVVIQEKPHLVLVAGDVNSTIACALVATKLHIKTAHLEAGLRSRDRSMPEEINRILTDQISDILLTPSADADENLRQEGISQSRIVRVGNAMIDSLVQHLTQARKTYPCSYRNVSRNNYALLTLHRPANVDSPETLASLLQTIGKLSKRLPFLLPLHPRTKKSIDKFSLHTILSANPNITLLEPLSYLEMLSLQSDARIVLTDSGGIQEETTALGIPCLTLRTNTERPITLTQGTNTLVGTDPIKITQGFEEILSHGGKRGSIPKLWDGNTGPRAARAITQALS